ncbi:hypothetical protein SAMN04487897_109113 [Paenibacillus sp. yr247]|uniref:hypothetical protein n=1 Tax=Paenibacillus sp. yr247 TaxID=1761880 RepID=UPI00088E8FEF|nr:hypothetical protein [Paenibacillus sp. yr247]SDO17763.1 hypothetical protein SAMN04487897_109113 [Paenibacillus sp. yr247]
MFKDGKYVTAKEKERIDCRDLSFAIRAYAMEHFADVVSEFKNMKIQKEIDLMKKFAEKHGYAITITSPAAMDFTNYELKPDGSLSFKF